MSLHSTEIGSAGQRVAFLHGLFGQGRNFTGVARALEPELRSLLVDLPDHGRSPWSEAGEPVSYVAIADAVAAHLRDAFAASGPVHLVGHSMGGKVAMVLALRHPDLVDRVVVVDIAPTPSDGSGEFEHLLGSLAGLDLDAVVRRGDADAQLAEQVDDERVRGFLLQNLRAVSAADRAATGGPAWRWQANLDLLRASLPAITGFPDLDPASTPGFDRPVLWMAGERSPYVRQADEPVMRALFPRVTQVTIKGAGHWVHAEQPESFVSALRVFLLA